MKFIVAIFLILTATGFGSTSVVAGEEIKLFGVIQKIEMAAPDGVSATVTVKETKSDKIVVITVTDTLTLDKLRDRRIVEGDDIRCKYEVIDGKNISRLFKKTAGC
jgi:hypothetical protein